MKGILQKTLENFKWQHMNDPEQEKKIIRRTVIKNIAFFGDAETPENHPDYKDAFEVAKLVAAEGYTIVNGGGPGIMNASTQGADEAGGETLSITFSPKETTEFEGKYLKNVTDEEIATTNYIERMFKLMEHSDIFIIFRGGTGTISELGTAWVLAKLYYGHHKPFILFGDFWKTVIGAIHDNLNIDEHEMDVFEIVRSREMIIPTIDHFKHKINQVEHDKHCRVCEEGSFLK